MAYAASNTGPPKRGGTSEPSGKSGGGTYSSKAGSAGVKGEPTGGLKTGGVTTKGNAKKLGR